MTFCQSIMAEGMKQVFLSNHHPTFSCVTRGNQLNENSTEFSQNMYHSNVLYIKQKTLFNASSVLLYTGEYV